MRGGGLRSMNNESSKESAKSSSLNTLLWLSAGVGVYLLLQLFILPKMGVAT